MLFYYSDNLNIASVVVRTDRSLDWEFQSLDGVKMEAQHSEEDIRFFNEMLMRNIFPHFTRDNATPFQRTCIAIMD